MFLIRIFALITLSALSITSAFAENSPMYFGLGYANARIKTINTSGTNTSHEADMYGGVLKFGYDLNNWFALEGHLSSTTTSDQLPQAYSVKVDHMAFVGARFNLRYNRFTVFALGGASYAKIKETSSGRPYTTTIVAPAYGVGLDFYGSGSTAITFSYIQYLDSTEVNLSAVQFGIKFYFDKPKIFNRY